MKTLRNLAVIGMIVMGSALVVRAHCEIPCGIYDDPLRINLMKEHITTIEKSINQIVELGKAQDKNYNQLVRWISNKDTHAEEFMHIVTQYFMTQRIKPVDETEKGAYKKYVKEVTLLHQMLVYAMKAKQTTDLENCTKLRELLEQFSESYFGQTKQATPVVEEHTH